MLALVGYVAVVQPKLLFDAPTRLRRRSTCPTGVLVLYGLLMLVFLGGVRFVVHVVYERPLRGFRARARTRARC